MNSLKEFFSSNVKAGMEDTNLTNSSSDDDEPKFSSNPVKKERDRLRNVVEMEKLIPLINDLHEIFKTTGSGGDEIKLPKIVVVGDQSSGKSSVLESLIGKPCLPRGAEMVTRAPIVIQLIPFSEDSPGDEDFWRFEFDDGIYFDNQDSPDLVRNEIQKRTDKLTDGKKSISTNKIVLRVLSNRVIPLTVVDLPGMVKLRGHDQPEDIEEQILNLIRDEICDTNSIILAVSSAGSDVATFGSVKMAQTFDPHFKRTLVVVTKLDVMDKGTNAAKLLRGDMIPGSPLIIGVVNRSHLDIMANKSIETAHDDERAFFRKHYPFLGDKCGSKYLASELNRILMIHIQQYLPSLKDQIDSQFNDYSEKQRSLGSIPSNVAEKRWVLEDTIRAFVDKFETSITTGAVSKNHLRTNFANKKIAKINRNYPDAILAFDFDQGHLATMIHKSLSESVTIENFTSIETTFKKLAFVKIMELKEIWIQAAKSYRKVLDELIDACIEGRWVQLNQLISRISRKVISDHLKITEYSIKEQMEIQTCMISSKDKCFENLLKMNCDASGIENQLENCYDEDESDAEEALEELTYVPCQEPGASSIPGKIGVKSIVRSNKVKNCNENSIIGHNLSFPMSTFKNTRLSGEYVHVLIDTYCNVIKRYIADFVPKHLFYNMFLKSVEKLTLELRNGTVGMESKLIADTEDLASRRQEILTRLQNLEKAKEVIEKHQSSAGSSSSW